MIPLLAAASVVGTASKVLDVVSSWGHKLSDGSGGQGAPTSFASLLKGQGVDVTNHPNKSARP